MKVIDVEPIINNLEKIKSILGYDAITIDGIVKALRDASDYKEPIIHAHIITNDLGDSSCSNCNTKYIDATSKYCHECGAKFDEPQVYKDRFCKT